jgi:Flp pilus assembly protein TadB
MILSAALLIISLSVTAGGIYWCLLFQQSVEAFSSHAFFEAEQLPATGLERYRMLQNDPDGKMLEKVKKAARLSARTGSLDWRERMLRLAGFRTAEDCRQFAMIAFAVMAGCAAAGFLIGAFSGLNAALVGGAVGAPCGAGGCLLYLHTQAQEQEQRYREGMVVVFEPLTSVLNNGTDLATTLKSLVASMPFEAGSNPVLIVFSSALERSEAGENISDALKSVCAATGMRHLSHLAGILTITEKQGAGWKKSLADIRTAVLSELAVKKGSRKEA